LRQEQQSRVADDDKGILLASFYTRYFGYYGALTLYTHTSDQYSVFGTRANLLFGARSALSSESTR
jgi:TnpA family transposase